MTLTNYYQDYQSERKICLDLDQFSSILMMLPSVLVAGSDREFDVLEKQNLAESLKEASQGNILTACEMYAELSYLMNADKSTLTKALSCIKEEIANREDFKTMVLELMVAMAESSDGISDDENKKIAELKAELSIH